MAYLTVMANYKDFKQQLPLALFIIPMALIVSWLQRI